MAGLSNQNTLNSQHRESNHIKIYKCLPKESVLLINMLPCQGQMFPLAQIIEVFMKTILVLQWLEV